MRTIIKKTLAFPFVLIFTILLLVWGAFVIPLMLTFSMPIFVIYALWHDDDVLDAIHESWNFSTCMVGPVLEDIWSDFI